MTYKNANRRILLLVQAGVIAEIKYSERVPHGRIDYKLTMKGLEYLIPHFLSHPQDVISIVKYMDKFGYNKRIYAELLIDRINYSIEAVNNYREYANIFFPLSLIKTKALLNNMQKMLSQRIVLDDRRYPIKSQELIKSQESFKEISEIYGCDICANFSLISPKYIISHSDGTSSFREPKAKNEKLFLHELKKALDHFDEEHSNVKRQLT